MENWDRTNIRVESSVIVKVRDINEKIKEGKSRRMRKELVGSLPVRTPFPRHTPQMHHKVIS